MNRLCLGGGLLGSCFLWCGSLLGSRLCRLSDTASLGLGQGRVLVGLGINVRYNAIRRHILTPELTYLGGGFLGRSGSLLRSGLLGGSGSLLLASSLGSSSLLGSSLLGGGSLLDTLLLGGRLLRFGLLLSKLGAARRTLGLSKDALLNASLQGLVEERVEHVVRDSAQVVVGLDILLQGLTAGAIAVLEL